MSRVKIGVQILASGRTIAAISRDLTNNGTLNGPTTARPVALLGDVNGVGNYTGNVRFSDRLSPALSATAIPLENFQLDPTSTLRINLGGVNAGTEFGGQKGLGECSIAIHQIIAQRLFTSA